MTSFNSFHISCSMLVVLLMLSLHINKHTHFGVLRSPLTLLSDSDGLLCVSSRTSTVTLQPKDINKMVYMNTQHCIL